MKDLSKPELKQFGDLSPGDFDRHPVWIGCHTADAQGRRRSGAAHSGRSRLSAAENYGRFCHLAAMNACAIAR